MARRSRGQQKPRATANTAAGRANETNSANVDANNRGAASVSVRLSVQYVTSGLVNICCDSCHQRLSLPAAGLAVVVTRHSFTVAASQTSNKHGRQPIPLLGAIRLPRPLHPSTLTVALHQPATSLFRSPSAGRTGPEEEKGRQARADPVSHRQPGCRKLPRHRRCRVPLRLRSAPRTRARVCAELRRLLLGRRGSGKATPPQLTPATAARRRCSRYGTEPERRIGRGRRRD